MTFAAEEMSHAVVAIVRLEYTNVDQEMKLEWNVLLVVMITFKLIEGFQML